MGNSAPPTLGLRAPDQNTDDLAPLSQALVRAAFDDQQWAEVVETYNLVALVGILKRVVADTGTQEQARNVGLARARDDDSVSDEQYDMMKRHHTIWIRHIGQVRQKIRYRINQVQPQAQAIIEAHQADRRALVILAKRIWLWEQGQEDRLDYALDEVTISDSVDDGYAQRITLRNLVEQIAMRAEVTP